MFVSDVICCTFQREKLTNFTDNTSSVTMDITAFKFYNGGLNSFVFEEFLEGVYKSILWNYNDQKSII